MTAPSERLLTLEALRALQIRSDFAGGMRLAIHVACLLGAGWWVAVASGWLVLPAVFVLGLVQVALFAPAHETMHQTAFASRRANAVVQWLTSAPSLLNAQFYTAFHAAHHRHTQIPGQDPELLAPPPATIGGYVSRILGWPFWRLRLLVVFDSWRGDLSRYPYVTPVAAPAIISSVRADEFGDGRRRGRLGVAVRLEDAVFVLDRPATIGPAAIARLICWPSIPAARMTATG